MLSVLHYVRHASLSISLLFEGAWLAPHSELEERNQSKHFKVEVRKKNNSQSSARLNTEHPLFK